jgi:transposase
MDEKKKASGNRSMAEEGPTQGAAPRRRSTTRLTLPQHFKLAEALRAEKDRLSSERPALEAVAQEFSRELGFQITANNIKAALEAVGIGWEQPRSHRRGQGAPRYDRARVLHAVREAVVGLLADQKRPVPDDLLADFEEAGHVFTHGAEVAGDG